jgi:ABC-type nickel/cobalt efflux system permease component RcnA
MRHSLEPDHLVAVSTMVAEEKRLWPAARLGLIWGTGHLTPLTLIGLPVLILRLKLPERMENVVDLGVGVLLIALGIRALWLLRRDRIHIHSHQHDGHAHVHFHSHAATPAHAHGHYAAAPQRFSLRNRREWMTFAIGLIHGLAGSGAAALLALTAAPSVNQGVFYLLIFGVGTCAGMFLTTLCIAAPALTTVSRFQKMHGVVRSAAGLASIAVGVLMWVRILPELR